MMKTSTLPFLSLFSSASTLVCCALPAVFVALGAGASFAGLVTQVPQLTWISEHKVPLFLFAGMMLLGSGVSLHRAKNLPCPIDAGQAEACRRARVWSKAVFGFSIFIYLIGATFAFGSRFLV